MCIHAWTFGCLYKDFCCLHQRGENKTRLSVWHNRQSWRHSVCSDQALLPHFRGATIENTSFFTQQCSLALAYTYHYKYLNEHVPVCVCMCRSEYVYKQTPPRNTKTSLSVNAQCLKQEWCDKKKLATCMYFHRGIDLFAFLIQFNNVGNES